MKHTSFAIALTPISAGISTHGEVPLRASHLARHAHFVLTFADLGPTASD
jgi:hypothetical protein